MTNIKTKILLFLLKSVALMPFRMLYAISDFLFLVIYYLIGYRRKVVLQNLHNSFPEKPDHEIKLIEKEFYRHLCDCIVETIKLLRMSDDELNRRITIKNAELIEQMAEDGKSVILLVGHMGNWEFGQKIVMHYKRPTENFFVYRPLKDKAFDEIFHVIRSRFNAGQLSQKATVRTLLKLSAEGRQFLVGFISDHRPPGKNVRHWTTFLNQETPYAVGGEEIGKHIGAHYAYLNIEKTKRGHYTLTFKDIQPADGEEYPYTISYLRMLEENIKCQPSYWLWSHKRWKKKNHIYKNEITNKQ